MVDADARMISTGTMLSPCGLTCTGFQELRFPDAVALAALCGVNGTAHARTELYLARHVHSLT